MQVSPELISYIELIVPRAHWRPPTKNEVLSRPKCRQGPADCVYTWGKNPQMCGKEKASMQGAWPHFWDMSENEMV